MTNEQIQPLITQIYAALACSGSISRMMTV